MIIISTKICCLFLYRVTGGRAIAQAVNCLLLTEKERGRSQASPCWLSGGKSDNGTGLSPSPSVLFCQYYPIYAPY